MRIIFGDDFREIPEKEFKISRKDVIRTVTNPLTRQIIIMDDLEVLLFLQKEKGLDSYLLVMGRRQDNILTVGCSCYRILPSLLEDAMTDEPIVLLQQLALNYGFPIKIGERIGKFFFRERIPVPKGLTPLELMKFFIPPESKGMTSAFLKVSTEGYIDFAIAFSIEIDDYMSWLRHKETIQVRAKTYDIFISYKRKTAEDFASHLKSCLTEQGYRAFLDLSDIPKEFEGTTRWFHVRDEAIKNSKRFLLLITVGIEKSEEIAEELSLARKVSQMKFMYLRHEDLEPQIVIKSGEEVIKLEEGNQVPFGTKEDLARKVLKILSESYKES